MPVLANPDDLVADGHISEDVAAIMKQKSRTLMVQMAINVILSFGILCATGGLIFWLASPLAVAVVGLALLAAGYGIRARGSDTYAMFGNAALLIGSGMLIGGAGIELVDKFPDMAGYIMVPAGALVMAIAVRALKTGGVSGPFVQGCVLIMGLGLHLSGAVFYLYHNDLSGVVNVIFNLYAALLIAATGWITNVRFVTALAILPFAQALQTGTYYFGAMYAFYSPESTLTILQMTALIAGMLYLSARRPERDARHADILAMMGFITANLSALVGSLFGDWVGETIWGPKYGELSYDDWRAARDAFRESAIHIPAGAYSVLWAVALAALIVWAAKTGRRGLFNASMTFAGIHAYTQLFESFYDQPLAYVLGGLAAIPLAWGLWRLDGWMSQRQNDA